MSEGKKLSYLLRDVPRPLWRSAKILAAESGMTLREMILSALSEYINTNNKKYDR
jgi:hypothetical protein